MARKYKYRLGDDFQSGYEILAELLRTQPAFLKIQKQGPREFESSSLYAGK
jgi:EAL domain-containing protein (putative c-di-GMP-specific phosphodiesterase class I)